MTKTVGKYVLKSFEHGVWTLQKKMNRVLAIPDLHAPFHHPDALKFLKDVKNMIEPDVVVCLGDEADMAFWSFHDKDPHMPGAKDEYHSALEFLGQLYELFPNVLCCISNHTDRPYRVGFKYGLISDFMRSRHEILQAPEGWFWGERFVIDDVCYIHGDPKSGRDAARLWMQEHRKSTVIGHIHAHGGLQYSASPFDQTFWMNAGCLVDNPALAFRYGAKYAHKPTLGCGFIENGVNANFIRMPT